MSEVSPDAQSPDAQPAQPESPDAQPAQPNRPPEETSVQPEPAVQSEPAEPLPAPVQSGDSPAPVEPPLPEPVSPGVTPPEGVDSAKVLRQYVDVAREMADLVNKRKALDQQAQAVEAAKVANATRTQQLKSTRVSLETMVKKMVLANGVPNQLYQVGEKDVLEIVVQDGEVAIVARELIRLA